MQNAGLDKAQAGIKMAGRNINNLRYADDTTLTAESEEELKSLLMKVPHPQINNDGTSLVVQGLRIHFTVHGTQIRSLVGKTPHAMGPTKHMCQHH